MLLLINTNWYSNGNTFLIELYEKYACNKLTSEEYHIIKIKDAKIA